MRSNVISIPARRKSTRTECDAGKEISLLDAFEQAEKRGRKGLVILGDPGSGKTTHIKRMLLWCLRNGPETMGLPRDMLPVFLPLRKIKHLEEGLDRLDDIQHRFLELQTERVEQRIARALLHIMKQSGRKTDHGIQIDFPLSRQDLANYTGTTLYTVSRTLSNWRKKSWIKSGRERIVVANPHALVTFAERG